jgi:endogenous inhibitor of DNA gyrase (YacG/DUF329 family)
MIYNTKATIDKYGKLIKQGGTCPVCGKTLEHIPMNAYCSIKCFTQDLLKRIALTKSKSTDSLDQILNNL